MFQHSAERRNALGSIAAHQWSGESGVKGGLHPQKQLFQPAVKCRLRDRDWGLERQVTTLPFITEFLENLSLYVFFCLPLPFIPKPSGIWPLFILFSYERICLFIVVQGWSIALSH